MGKTESIQVSFENCLASAFCHQRTFVRHAVKLILLVSLLD